MALACIVCTLLVPAAQLHEASADICAVFELDHAALL
jgi:hypothetical protein